MVLLPQREKEQQIGRCSERAYSRPTLAVERSPEEAQPEVRASDDVSKQVVRESASIGYFAQQGDSDGKESSRPSTHRLRIGSSILDCGKRCKMKDQERRSTRCRHSQAK